MLGDRVADVVGRPDDVISDVRTASFHGKLKRMGRHQGRRPDWKKAIVTLAPGHKIDLVEGA